MEIQEPPLTPYQNGLRSTVFRFSTLVMRSRIPYIIRFIGLVVSAEMKRIWLCSRRIKYGQAKAMSAPASMQTRIVWMTHQTSLEINENSPYSL